MRFDTHKTAKVQLIRHQHGHCPDLAGPQMSNAQCSTACGKSRDCRRLLLQVPTTIHLRANDYHFWAVQVFLSTLSPSLPHFPRRGVYRVTRLAREVTGLKVALRCLPSQASKPRCLSLANPSGRRRRRWCALGATPSIVRENLLTSSRVQIRFLKVAAQRVHSCNSTNSVLRSTGIP